MHSGGLAATAAGVYPAVNDADVFGLERSVGVHFDNGHKISVPVVNIYHTVAVQDEINELVVAGAALRDLSERVGNALEFG